MKNREKLKKQIEEREKPYWDRRINIAHRKINRKKHYGIGVEINNYKEKVREAVDIEKAVDTLKNNKKEDYKTKQDLIDSIAALVSVQQLGQNNELQAAITGIFSDSFKKGTRRLFTKQGDRVDVDQFVDQAAVSNIMKDQDKYFQNLTQDVQQKTEDVLRQGFEEGKGTSEIARNLEQEIDSFTRNRAETIARSECIKASSEGTKATMEKAGVKKFTWLSARDSTVCEKGSFESNFNGKTYTSCRELDGETFDKDGYHPMPVRDSHPNCRCTLVAEVEDE